ncbi:YMGG-like glycine zipper-containing protein [Desertivirga xinjiangensis]|uniref:YMGG-like glycine zipper-containing protein n=1 Tax=Desertivirga xinjiangensis TaxID=539206 RepID=UPI00210A9A92|nr:YMGG-like glycine zipper-containing protein [Pedobacter xinjiangensis]
MKKSIQYIFAIAALFAGCNNGSKTEAQAREVALKQIRDSIKLDSFRVAEVRQVELAKEKAELASSKNTSGNSSSQKTYVNGISESYTSSEPARKGWSKAAKGAVIGAGAGALTGVIVDKKDGRGAVIGGLAGAGAGYVIGRSQDKKDGRVQ